MKVTNTETWYFRKLIDIRKSLNIHPLIDIRLLEKTEEDKDISFPRKLIAFAESQKKNPEISFDEEHDKMVIVFDADIFEEKVQDYDTVVTLGEKNNILAVTVDNLWSLAPNITATTSCTINNTVEKNGIENKVNSIPV